MNSKPIVITLLLCFFSILLVQAGDPGEKKPKLVVGIVVDQMRYDYITRYWNKFSDSGFKKLVNEGFNCTNAHYNYFPTKTAPGHASIYTGTTPAVHGILGNDWYNIEQRKNIYCVADSTMNGVGTLTSSGKMSPKNLLSTTITDELRLASNFKSKVISISLKDRSSILPSGHCANAAYWFEISSGNFISSSWYLKQLPEWVVKFNDRKLPSAYLKKPWNTLLPIEQYTESTTDNTPYEEKFVGETQPVFPHNFPLIGPENYELVRKSPYGNNLTLEFALAAIEAEALGTHDATDFLALSFSSTDEVGHMFGTHAIETEDVYLRLDRDLSQLISTIEKKLGKENVLFFLTADHAAVPNVTLLAENKIPSGVINVNATRDSLNNFLSAKYGNQPWMLSLFYDQIFLDHDLLTKNNISIDEMSKDIRTFLMKTKGIGDVLLKKDLSSQQYNSGLKAMFQRGFNPKRSGDLVIVLEPGYIEFRLTGTDHGSTFMYDTHVPMIFYGYNIQKGTTAHKIEITDLAPTVSQILGIQSPSGSEGKVIEQLLDNKK